MSENLAEWMIVLTFCILVIGFTFAEAVWLSRKGWTGFGKSLAFSALSNLISFPIGFFVVFIVIVIIIMLIFDGSVKNSSMGEYVLTAVLILAALFAPALLTICKRIFLSILKIRTGKPAWFYALASSVLILVISLGIPILIGYFLYR